MCDNLQIIRLNNSSSDCRRFLLLSHEDHFLHFTDGETGIQTLGAGSGAVHDGVAFIDRPFVVHLVETLVQIFVPAVDHPPVGLHENCRSKVLVTMPPVAWTRGTTACTQDALVQAVQLSPVFDGLQVFFTVRGRSISLQIWFDVSVLFVKVGHIWDQVFNHIHVWERVNLGRVFQHIVDFTNTCECVLAVDIHRTRSTYSFPTGASECESGVLF